MSEFFFRKKEFGILDSNLRAWPTNLIYYLWRDFSNFIKLQTSNFKAQILAAFTRSHLADNMFPRRTSPVAWFMIGWWVPRVKIILVHLAKNPNSRADVAATWHSLLVTMSSISVTIIIFGHYIRLLLYYVPSPAPERERYLAAARVARRGGVF